MKAAAAAATSKVTFSLVRDYRSGKQKNRRHRNFLFITFYCFDI
jgi:hypothetical protein